MKRSNFSCIELIEAEIHFIKTLSIRNSFQPILEVEPPAAAGTVSSDTKLYWPLHWYMMMRRPGPMQLQLLCVSCVCAWQESMGSAWAIGSEICIAPIWDAAFLLPFWFGTLYPSSPFSPGRSTFYAVLPELYINIASCFHWSNMTDNSKPKMSKNEKKPLNRQSSSWYNLSFLDYG